MEDRGLIVRAARPADYDTIIAVVDGWWGRAMSAGLPRLFLDHFFGTSLIAEHDGELAGFLIGFGSPSKPEEAGGSLHSLRRSGTSVAPYRTGAQPVRAVL